MKTTKPNHPFLLVCAVSIIAFFGGQYTVLRDAKQSVRVSETYAQGVSGELPTGTVVPFDLSACPDGWSEFTAARGRVIIGTNPSQFSNPSGEGIISARSSGVVGGAETHTLTIDEMPSHTHEVNANSGGYGGDLPPDYVPVGVRVESEWA